MNNNIWDSITEELVKDDSHVIADKDVLLSNIEQLKKQKLNIWK